MSLRNALLVTAVMGLPALAPAAQAQQLRGLYIGGAVGVNFMSDSDVTVLLPGDTRASNTGTVSFEDGFVGLLSLGYGFGNGFRAEIEGNYRTNQVDSFTGLSVPNNNITSTGNVFTWGVMLNGLYDFNLGWPVIPYVGGGIGAVSTNWNNVRQQLRNDSASYTHVVGTDVAFAYQAILGMAVPLRDVAPGLAMTLEYRAFAQLDGDRDASRYNGNAPRLVGTAETTGFSQSLLIGLRYNFGQNRPAPAPVPAVAPVPARSFLVFFDWDRATLTDRARQIIGEAAAASRSAPTTRIEVAGHADRSGTPQYNQRLSQRRADAVAAELERQGVSRAAMVIQAFGETRPLVPTADGVREPQNRRVEIVLR